MEQFKVGDVVTIHAVSGETGRWNGVPFGSEVLIIEDDGTTQGCNFRVKHIPTGMVSYCYTHRMKPINSNNMELKTTKEKVLAAAATSDIAKKLLKELHPEAFADEWVRVSKFEPIKKGGIVVLAPAGFDDCDFYVPRGLKIVAHPEHDGYYRIEKR